MARFIYKPSGAVVEVGEGKSLPASMFQPIDEPTSEPLETAPAEPEEAPEPEPEEAAEPEPEEAAEPEPEEHEWKPSSRGGRKRSKE